MSDKVAVFLIEDECLIEEVVRMALEDAGFGVVSVHSGDAALAQLDKDSPIAFKAVVTDIRLGSGPDGWAVASRARELSSEIAVVYMTGDSAHDWPVKGVPKSTLVTKPFAPVQIVTAVAALLNDQTAHSS